MKKTLLILILLIINSALFAQTPVWQWANLSGGGTSNNAPTHIARDAAGYSYITSEFTATRSFGPLSMTAYGLTDISVMKVDPTGGVVWSQHFGAASTICNSGGIGVDGAGNVYVAGNFGFNIYINSNYTFSTAGQNDMVLIKMDSSGSVIWAKQFGGAGSDVPYSLAVSGNNLVLAGSYTNTFAINTVNFATPAGSAEDIFIAKFDTSGTCQWGYGFGSAVGDRATSTTVSSTNVYVAGYFQNTVMFGTTSLSSAGGNDLFVAKYDLSGNLIWAKKAGSISTDQVNAISCDANGNAYVTGMFYGTVNFGLTPGGASNILAESPIGYGDCFIARYNSLDGTCAWARRIHSGSNDQGVAISTDPLGGSFVTGFYGGAATIQTGAATSTSFSTHGGNDCFIIKYDQNGTMMWGINIGGSSDDRGKGILYDVGGYCNIGGYIGGTVAFGAVGSLTTPSGVYSLFYGRLNGFTTGVQVINKELNISVYPNPAADNIHISTNENDPISAVELYDMQGQVVRSTPMISTANEASFDVNGVAAGSYVVYVISKTGVGSKLIQIK